ncbi:serine/threonine-protein kinase [Gemmatimonas sp.]|uniref:serine/threonine-protein kinase n=1 Tax=Gemmatimonas sp. TaxID=1962908 RepID=UPI0033407F93
MTEVRDTLQAALAPHYTIERELGGGGMSRVFLATETRFSRTVVIKLLAPELASGVSVERFEREIALAAGLSQANIVPLLSAGVANGLPWYSMPYVAGESLRERLARGPLSEIEATSVLRDVARALAYAHERGIVHRDIKPENVLLSGDAAVVTDFGIAKALSAAKAERGELTLTQMGTSVGTPGYMAPEQAAGGTVDVRADVYAWSVMAYELMSGRHPFADRVTAQQLLAAHIAEVPAPLHEGTPLGALIMQGLAKDPEARPSSGRVMLDSLEVGLRSASPNERPALRRPRLRRVAIAAGVVVGLLSVGWFLIPAPLRAAAITLATRPPARLRLNRVVVSPLTNETGDAALASLGALSAAYLTEAITKLPHLEVVDSRSADAAGAVVGAIPRLLRRNDEQALADETGAAVVVLGAYFREGDQLSFRVRIVDAVSGKVRQALPPVVGSAQAPSAALSDLAKRVVGSLAMASDTTMSPDAPSFSAPPSLEAFAAFGRSLDAFVAHRPDSEITAPLRTAAFSDDPWGSSVQLLAFMANAVGQYALADSALGIGQRYRDRFADAELQSLRLTDAEARGDIAASLDAAKRGKLLPVLIADVASNGRRPRIAIETLREDDADRGFNFGAPSIYYGQLHSAYLAVGDWKGALNTARAWSRREPYLTYRIPATEAYIAAATGDVAAMRTALASISTGTKTGDEDFERSVVNATVLLRGRSGREAEGVAYLNSLAGTLKPVPAGAGEARLMWRGELLIAQERWADALDALSARELAVSRDLKNGVLWPSEAGAARDEMAIRRAVVYLHTGRRAEALRIDSAFATRVDARWNRGFAAYARAVIAAHLGQYDTAMELLSNAVSHGALAFVGDRAYRSVEADLVLLPLRNDPRFKLLARPDPVDER